MKRAALAMMVLALFAAPSGFADSVHNFAMTQVQVYFDLDTEGDNMGFSFSGPHGNLVTGWGAVVCDFCSPQNTYAPGDSLYLTGDFFVEGTSHLKLGGNTYDPVTLFSSTINGETITFPKGGGFSVTVPATFGPVSGNGGQGQYFINFNLNTPPKGKLDRGLQLGRGYGALHVFIRGVHCDDDGSRTNDHQLYGTWTLRARWGDSEEDSLNSRIIAGYTGITPPWRLGWRREPSENHPLSMPILPLIVSCSIAPNC